MTTDGDATVVHVGPVEAAPWVLLTPAATVALIESLQAAIDDMNSGG
jgi:hypothetical protein